MSSSNNSSGHQRPPLPNGRGRSDGAAATTNNSSNSSRRSSSSSTTTTGAGRTSSSRAPLAPLPPLPAHLRGSNATTTPSERSALLSSSGRRRQQTQRNNNDSAGGSDQQDSSGPGCLSIGCISATGATVMSLLIFAGVYLASNDPAADTALNHWLFPHRQSPHYAFPSNFTWGVATSSYQIEGAVHADGRGDSIWDTFCQRPGTVLDHSDGSVACDHYHRVNQDVQLMASLGIKAYRFSIAWPRILPNGTGEVNPAGLDFYNHLINTLLRYEIEPWVTLFHWDLPQALEDRYRGWLQIETAYAFREYADVCFRAFGDRVSRWITLNEAWTVAINGYATGIHAPGHQSLTEPYIVGHHLLLAHGLAVKAFREYQNQNNNATNTTQPPGAMIGIANCGDFRYPLTVADNATAQRVMEFQMGWFSDPLFFGEYPDVMRQRLRERLPTFSAEQRELLMSHPIDFVGLNYYSALQASTPATPPAMPGYWTSDINAHLHPHPDWRLNDMGWAVVPDGLRNMLEWVSQRYDGPLIVVTENGDAEHRDLVKPLQDVKRQDFLQGHIRAIGQAIEMGVQVGGYFAWSLMDNFEWQFGYTKKFGIVNVDFADKSLRRTPKDSAYWYNRTINERGKNIHRAPPLSWFPSV